MWNIFQKKKEIELNRKVNRLDKFVLDFCNLLDLYVLVSGYVSILFGRSRATEDVDLLIPKMEFSEFKSLWERFDKGGFECLNTHDVQEAFNILDEHNICFSRKGKPIPNMEFKIIQNEIHEYSYKNKIKVVLKEGVLYISPIEMQIAYKSMLGKQGNTKDLEDAKHLYELFKEKLDMEEFNKLIKELDCEGEYGIIK